MLLTLAARHREAEGVESFQFQPDRSFTFKAGQYLRYMLKHDEPDERGSSRFFTISSAPSEGFVMLTTRFSAPGSSFKQALRRLEEGVAVEAAGPYGSFVLTDDDRPKVLIAGGIGVTPFRSMLVELANRRLDLDITLLYANSTPDIAFRRLFDDLSARQCHLKVVYTVSQPDPGWAGPVGRIDEPFIEEHTCVAEAFFYVSGPKPMVDGMAKTLAAMGVAAGRLKQDFFPGYDW